MTDPLILLWPDSGPEIGLGHVGRLAALGEVLGSRCGFHIQDPAATGWLKARGHMVVEDLLSAEIIVLDHRDPVDPDHVLAMQAAGSVVVLVDDVGPARLVADMVVDPPTYSQWPPAGGQVFAGLNHALLRSEWRAARDATVARSGVVLSFGGTDPYGLTEPAARAALRTCDLVTAIVGPGARSPHKTADHFVISPPDFALRVASCELLVTAFGHLVLEAASVGTPVISVATRDDHFRDATDLASRYGLMRVVDARTDFNPNVLENAVAGALQDPSWREFVAARGPSLIDGQGARRVGEALLNSQ